MTCLSASPDEQSRAPAGQQERSGSGGRAARRELSASMQACRRVPGELEELQASCAGLRAGNKLACLGLAVVRGFCHGVGRVLFFAVFPFFVLVYPAGVNACRLFPAEGNASVW